MTRGGLTFLLGVWVIVWAMRCFESFQHLPTPDAAAQPRSLDAGASAGSGAQMQMPRPEDGVEPSVATAFLQVGLLQIAESGLDEALLAACEVPLHRGMQQQQLDLQFGSSAEFDWGNRSRRLQGLPYRDERHAELPESFGEVSRRIGVEFVWHGESPAGHLLQVLDDRSEHADRSPGSSGRGSGGLCLPSVVLPWNQPWLFPQLHRGNVLIFRIVARSTSVEDLGKVEFWRSACSELAQASPRDAVSEPPLGALATERAQHPFVVADPFESACLASIVFRDRELASAVMAKRSGYIDLPIEVWPRDQSAFYRQVWTNGRMAAVATLLGDGSVMPWSVGEFSFQHAVAWRCLLLQNDPTIASAMVDALLPRLRTNSLFLMLLRHSDLSVAPPVAAAWERLHSAALGKIGLPWSAVLGVPGGLILYLLFPFVLGALVVSGRARSRTRVPLGRGMLFVLFLGAFVTLCEVALRPLLALFVVLLASEDVRSSPARSVWSRLLILFAVAATVFDAMRGTRFELQLLPLRVFAEAGSVLVWILVGWRVVEDGRWRSPGFYSVFLLGSMGLWSLAPIRPAVPPSQDLVWVVWVAFGAFALFLLRGRRDPDRVENLAYAHAP